MSGSPSKGSDEERRWKNMLKWLKAKGLDDQIVVEPRTRQGAGRGLFSTRPLQPASARTSPLLRIPEAALLNSKTLNAIYPSIALEGGFNTSSAGLILNGTQLLSMHLAMNRPLDQTESQDPHFGPYISTLPRDFSSHPLSWIVKRERKIAEPLELELLDSLSPCVLSELQVVAKRFRNDWEIVLRCKETNREVFNLAEQKRHLNEDNFLWGWLIVNTRCLYYKIFTQNFPLSNLTLCPIVDFANHTSSISLPCAIPQTISENIWTNRKDHSAKAHDFVLLSPSQAVNDGEEIFLRYGGHCNRTLFVEYGFVGECTKEEVDASDLVNNLLEQKNAGKQIKQILGSEGYSNDLSMYASPQPAHPSWRLLCALRLTNLDFPTSSEIESVLQPWRNVAWGLADIVSEANESAVRKDLDKICEIVTARSGIMVARLQNNEVGLVAGNECMWYEWAKGNVVRLWEEEGQVARLVLDSVRGGCMF